MLVFAIFEQKDTFFKKSLKILGIYFFQIGKKCFSEIIYISRKQEETVRLASLSIYFQCCQFIYFFAILELRFQRDLDIQNRVFQS
jgi:hypothetical protein